MMKLLKCMSIKKYRNVYQICLTSSHGRYLLSSGFYDGKINIVSLETGAIIEASDALARLENSIPAQKIVFDEQSYFAYKIAKRKFFCPEAVGAMIGSLILSQIVTKLIELQDGLDAKDILLSSKMRKIFQSKFANISVTNLAPEVENILALIDSLSSCRRKSFSRRRISGLYI